VNQAGIAGRQGGQRRAIDLGLVDGGDGQRRRGDRQGPCNVADRVVAVGRPAGGNWVGARRDWAVSGGGGAQHRQGGQACAGVTVDEAGVGRGERRQRGAVNLGVVDCGDRQRRRGDRLSAPLGSGRVVGVAGVDGPDRVGANLKVGEQVDGGRAVDQGDSRAEETAVDLELDGTSGRRIAARGGGDGGGRGDVVAVGRARAGADRQRHGGSRLIVDGQGAVHV